MESAIKEIQHSRRSLLVLAILSGSIEAVKGVNKIVNEHIKEDDKVDLIRQCELASKTILRVSQLTLSRTRELKTRRFESYTWTLL